MGRWDWTQTRCDPGLTRLGDHAAARYRHCRQRIEAVPQVDGMLYGLLLAIESAREELQPYETALAWVQLAETNSVVQHLKRLHRVIDEAVASTDGVLEPMEQEEWMESISQERQERVEWYRGALTFLVGQANTAVQQAEALTLMKAAVDEDMINKELTQDEVKIMETVFDLVAVDADMLVVSVPDWFVMPLSWASSFGFSSWGGQRLEVDPESAAKAMRSASIWKTLNHPNVARFLGACLVGDRPFMVHESARPLLSVLTDRGERPERMLVWKRLHEILRGLRYLHDRGLAPVNLTLDAMWIARFEGKAVLGCGDVARIEEAKDAVLSNLRAFATSIFNLWRKIDSYYRSLNALYVDELDIADEAFPLKCPKFIELHGWEVLEQLARCTTSEEATDKMNQLAGFVVSNHELKVKQQVRDKTMTLEDFILPSRDLSIGECLRLCKGYLDDGDVRDQVYGRLIDLLEQLKLAMKRQSSECTGAIAAYCTCLGLLWTSLLDRPSCSSLSASGSTTRPSTLEDDRDELHEKLDLLIDSYDRFSRVRRGKWVDTPVVVKLIEQNKLDAPEAVLKKRRQFVDEADIWFTLNHVNIVKMYGACDDESPFLVCGHAGEGQLDAFLAKHRQENPSLIWYSLLNAALGLQYLHQVGIVHGDLKLNNILVGNDGIAKLCDFGLSLDVHNCSSCDEGAVGAWSWKAPECLPWNEKPGERATFASDVFSFAMCMIEAGSGQVPWFSIGVGIAVKYHVKNGRIPQRPEAMTASEWDGPWGLIKRMTCLDPEKRVTMDAVVAHLYSILVGLDLKRLQETHGMFVYDNEVVARPQALLALLTLARSPNRSLSLLAGNHVVLMQYYRWNQAAGLQEITAIVELLQDVKNEHVVEWATTALANLCWSSERNRTLVRQAHGIPALAGLFRPATSESRRSVAATAAQVLRYLVKGSKTIRDELSTSGAIYRLVGLFRVGNETERYESVAALVKISTDRYNCDQIVEAGAVPMLVCLKNNGNAATRGNAAAVLANVAVVPKYESAVAEAGAIPYFVRMLESKDFDSAVFATGLLNLAASPLNCRLISRAGAISPLLRLVKTGSDDEKMSAAGALGELTIESDIRNQISSDSFPAFVDLVRSGTVLQQEKAVKVLQNLSLIDANEVAIVKAGAVSPLLQLVGNGNDLLMECAAATLMNLAHNAFNKRAIIDAGGVPRLVTLLQRGHQVQQENAIAALWYLVVGNAIEIPVQIVNADMIPLLVQLMESGSTPRQRDEALKIVRQFSLACSEHRGVSIKVIAPLLKVVESHYSPARAVAAAALANLAFQQTTEVASEIDKCGGIHILVGLLGGRPCPEREYATTALMNLTAMGDELETAVANARGIKALIRLSQVGTERERDLAQRAWMNFLSKEKLTSKIL